MSDVRIAAAFDANLPNLDRTVRINSFYDAQVFVRRWAIRDKDRVIRALLRRMERANSSEAANSTLGASRSELPAARNWRRSVFIAFPAIRPRGPD